jgi:hypothetical protein
MYLTRSLRVIAPALLGIALAASPSSAHTSTVPASAVASKTITGLFSLTLIGEKTHAEQRVELILEYVDGKYDALLKGATYATALDSITFDGETLRANAATSIGRGELILHVADQRITGTLIVGANTIIVKGERLH